MQASARNLPVLSSLLLLFCRTRILGQGPAIQGHTTFREALPINAARSAYADCIRKLALCQECRAGAIGGVREDCEAGDKERVAAVAVEITQLAFSAQK